MNSCRCPEFEKTCMIILNVAGGVLIRLNEQCPTINHYADQLQRLRNTKFTSKDFPHKGGDMMRK